MVKWDRVAFPDANALRGIWGHPPNFGVEQTEPLLGLLHFLSYRFRVIYYG